MSEFYHYLISINSSFHHLLKPNSAQNTYFVKPFQSNPNVTGIPTISVSMGWNKIVAIRKYLYFLKIVFC